MAKLAAFEEIKDKLDDALPDLEKTGVNEMYSKSKNIMIQITTARKVKNDVYTNFQQDATLRKPALAILISMNDQIPYRIESSPCLSYYIHIDDLNERLIDSIKRLPEIKVIKASKTKPQAPKAAKEAKETKEAKAAKEAKETTSKKPKADKSEKEEKEEKETKPTKVSFIDKYPATVDGFDEYCSEVPKSKIEYTKAKAKWPELMKDFPKLQDFKDYIDALNGNEEPKHEKVKTSAATLEDLTNYLLSTPASKLRAAYIKEQFGNLEESKMTIAKLKEWQKELKENQ